MARFSSILFLAYICLWSSWFRSFSLPLRNFVLYIRHSDIFIIDNAYTFIKHTENQTCDTFDGHNTDYNR